MSQRIFLMGFMASGKSSFSKSLGKKLELPSFDLDHIIEQEQGKSINELVAEQSISAFRELESEALKQWIAQNPSGVIALGGGTPCSDVNLKLIKDSGTSIYLKVPNEILIGRLRENKANRPLVKELDDKAIANLVEAKMEERKVYYESADLICDKIPFKVGELALLLSSS